MQIAVRPKPERRDAAQLITLIRRDHVAAVAHDARIGIRLLPEKKEIGALDLFEKGLVLLRKGRLAGKRSKRRGQLPGGICEGGRTESGPCEGDTDARFRRVCSTSRRRMRLDLQSPRIYRIIVILGGGAKVFAGQGLLRLNLYE